MDSSKKKKPFILTDKAGEEDLPSALRNRFFRVIKLTMNNDDGEKNRIIDKIGALLFVSSLYYYGCITRSSGGVRLHLARESFIEGAPS